MKTPEDYFYLGAVESPVQKIPLRSRHALFYDQAFGSHISAEKVEGKSVLDAGAGFSEGVKTMAERGAKITGIDVKYGTMDSSSLLEASHQRVNKLSTDRRLAKKNLDSSKSLMPSFLANSFVQKIASVINPYYSRYKSTMVKFSNFHRKEHLALIRFLEDFELNPENYINDDLRELSTIDDESIDLYLSAFLYPFHFLNDPESYYKGLKEMLRVLKPTGSAVLFPFHEDMNFTPWIRQQLAERKFELNTELTELGPEAWIDPNLGLKRAIIRPIENQKIT